MHLYTQVLKDSNQISINDVVNPIRSTTDGAAPQHLPPVQQEKEEEEEEEGIEENTSNAPAGNAHSLIHTSIHTYIHTYIHACIYSNS